MTRRWAYLDHPGPIAFAHRGGGAEKPENTMAAFEHAVALGYRYLETDARTTSDGVLLAFHDEVLDRVSDRRGCVGDLPWAEVRVVRLDGEPIALLEDVLGTWPDHRVNIDAKDEASVALLAGLVDKMNAHDRVCLGAFSKVRLARLRRLTGHRVCTSMSPVEVARLRLAAYGVPAGRFDAGCAQVPLDKRGIPLADRRMVDAAHRAGLQLHVWTVDDPALMDRLLDVGVDGLMTDRPTVLNEVLVRRGTWTW